ncbi:hypothetical protein CRG98_032748 [Punica granatum]|uniref:Uncharacterized protein n=1 Tax=Punica granatum TaxID=22663 RepID=A0A2I0IS85_PUNGR|nr:hypothetical protein CRG98_032748 [Punica granatum]
MVSITKENLIEPLEIEIAEGPTHCNSIEASEAKPWYEDIKNLLRTGQYPPIRRSPRSKDSQTPRDTLFSKRRGEELGPLEKSKRAVGGTYRQRTPKIAKLALRHHSSPSHRSTERAPGTRSADKQTTPQNGPTGTQGSPRSGNKLQTTSWNSTRFPEGHFNGHECFPASLRGTSTENRDRSDSRTPQDIQGILRKSRSQVPRASLGQRSSAEDDEPTIPTGQKGHQNKCQDAQRAIGGRGDTKLRSERPNRAKPTLEAPSRPNPKVQSGPESSLPRTPNPPTCHFFPRLRRVVPSRSKGSSRPSPSSVKRWSRSEGRPTVHNLRFLRFLSSGLRHVRDLSRTPRSAPKESNELDLASCRARSSRADSFFLGLPRDFGSSDFASAFTAFRTSRPPYCFPRALALHLPLHILQIPIMLLSYDRRGELPRRVTIEACQSDQRHFRTRSGDILHKPGHPDLSRTPFLAELPGPAPLTNRRPPKMGLQAPRDHQGRETSFRRPPGTRLGFPRDISMVMNVSRRAFVARLRKIETAVIPEHLKTFREY